MKDKFKDTEMLEKLGEARSGRISRRDFLNYSMAAGVAASAATGLWTTKAKAQPKAGRNLQGRHS